MTTMSITVQSVRNRIRPHNRGSILTWVSIGTLAVAVLLALFGPLLAPHDPNQTDIIHAYFAPTADHWLGQDSQGRDVLSRLIVGARSSMTGPFVVVFVAMIVGTVVALSAAWLNGWVDSGVSTLTDIMLGFPAIVLAVLASSVFGPGLIGPTIALGLAYIPTTIRVLRSFIIRERAKDYILAYEVQGLSGLLICARHLFPNILPMVIAQATLLFGYAMVDFAAISFLGLGVQPPTPDWGVMVATGQRGVLLGYPMESLAAGACIVAVVLAVNFVGQRISDRNEP